MNYPTTAADGLIVRKQRDDVSAVLNRMSDTIGRAVDFGTHVFNWCGPESSGKSFALLPPLMLLFHCTEAADSISLLVRGGSIDPCGPLLRTEMEGALGIFYILQTDTERRGLAYRFGRYFAESSALERLDITTQKGQEAERRLASDVSFGGVLPKPDPAQIAAARADVANRMADARFDKVRSAWQAWQSSHRDRPPHWYSLFGGPTSVAELAQRVGVVGWYDLFYRNFSDEVHSTTAMNSIRNSGVANRALIKPIRYPDGAQLCFQLCTSLLFYVYQSMIGRFCPAQMQAFQDWYAETIQRDFLELGNTIIKGS